MQARIVGPTTRLMQINVHLEKKKKKNYVNNNVIKNLHLH